MRRGPRDAHGVVLLVPVLDFGGVESRIVIQAAGMATSPFHLRVCCFEQDGRAADLVRDLGVPVDVLGTRPTVRNPVGLLRLWRYLRHHRPSILHARTGAMTVQGLVAASLARVPVRIAEEVGIPTRGAFGRVLFPLIYRLATCVIAVSSSVAEYLEAHDGVPRRKVRRVYNAVDARHFTPVERPARTTVDVLSVGRLVPVKAFDVLIEAMAPLLREPGTRLRLTIAGDGAERERLVKLAEAFGVAEQVRFLGHRTDVPDLLASADVFVLSSRSEGFALAVVEAMAARVPVIATSVGGVPEVVPTWAAEWLVDADDPLALRAAIDRMRHLRPEVRDELGERLRAHAQERFGPGQYVERLGSLYAELLTAQEGRR
jgi:glycosyltransferase involved in cell wall biosynthesis